jgi:hypothetical protein
VDSLIKLDGFRFKSQEQGCLCDARLLAFKKQCRSPISIGFYVAVYIAPLFTGDCGMLKRPFNPSLLNSYTSCRCETLNEFCITSMEDRGADDPAELTSDRITAVATSRKLGHFMILSGFSRSFSIVTLFSRFVELARKGYPPGLLARRRRAVRM